MAANDNNSPGEWVLTYLPIRLVRALDRYMQEDTKLESRSVALRAAFHDWCIHAGYVSANETDQDLN